MSQSRAYGRYAVGPRPTLDTDALPARPKHAADHAKKDHSSPTRTLTGPAPSGMTDSLTADCPLWTVGRL